jgi:formylglycine-generating enzyme required for sulfatase activity
MSSDPNPSQQQPRTWLPWLAFWLIGGGIVVGLGYLVMGPMLLPPKVKATAHGTPSSSIPLQATPALERSAAGAEQTPLQRIAQTTDRDELLRMAEAEPFYRADVETRLAALGYHRLVKRGDVVWLRSGPDESFSECTDCPEMAVLPAATFLMGSPSSEPGRQDDEDDTPGPGGNPVSVTIARAFAIGKYEITRGQFAAFVKATGYRVDPGCYAREGSPQIRSELSWTAPGFEQDDRHPVTCVSWRDAVAYVRWLSATTGAAYRLLTEAEWEYAARGGSTARFGFGDTDVELCKYGNGADLTSREADPDWRAVLCRDGFRFTAPVGSFKSNAFGLYDMHGNVWEWVEDCQSDSLGHLSEPEASGGARVSHPCSSDTPRILRGGSWSDPPQRLRSAARIAGPPDARDYIVGFRVARTLEPER